MLKIIFRVSGLSKAPMIPDCGLPTSAAAGGTGAGDAIEVRAGRGRIRRGSGPAAQAPSRGRLDRAVVERPAKLCVYLMGI
jgi:hypothetical protein